MLHVLVVQLKMSSRLGCMLHVHVVQLKIPSRLGFVLLIWRRLAARALFA